MNLADYKSTIPSEPTPIIRIMRNLLERGYEKIRIPKRTRGNLQLWTGNVRNLLTKIYGKNSQQLSSFPIVERDFPEHLAYNEFSNRLKHLERMAEALKSLTQDTYKQSVGKRIFIGHGRSLLWRELKDFISDRLGLPWDEFNREAVAGYTTTERLKSMMQQFAFAFLVMTAEEEHADASLHARPNVIHEIGLFQGYLGLSRAIVILEEGCSEFSNIIGLSQIRFPRGDISARFEEIRLVLERDELI